MACSGQAAMDRATAPDSIDLKLAGTSALQRDRSRTISRKMRCRRWPDERKIAAVVVIAARALARPRSSLRTLRPRQPVNHCHTMCPESPATSGR